MFTLAGRLARRALASTTRCYLPPFKHLTLPALSPTMEHGNITEIAFKVGDTFEEGDDLAQIETDKATVAWEIVGEEGIIAKIFAPEGSKNIKVGSTVAIYVENEADVAAFKDVTLEQLTGGGVAAPVANAAAPTAVEQAAAPAASSYPEHQVIPLPALSPTMEKGVIASWAVKVGDEVEEAMVVAEIETDKATVGFEFMDEGFVAKILVEAGGKGCAVGAPVLILVDDPSKIPAFDNYKAGSIVAAPVAPAQPAPVAAAAPTPSAPIEAAVVAKTQSGDRIIISPLAKKLAASEQVDLDQLAANSSATGPNGRYREADVSAFVQRIKSGEFQKVADAPSAAAPAAGVAAPPQPTVVSPPKPAAEWALTSKQTIPHYYLTVEIALTEIDGLVATLNAVQKDAEISREDFILKGAALACRDVPDANSEWLAAQNVMRQYLTVNIETENDAHIYNVGQTGLKDLRTKIDASTRDAGQPTMSVYSYIDSAVDSAGAVIKPGQACALTIGGARREIVPDADGRPILQNTLSCTLSCDHRLVDGAVGAQWLKHFKGYLETPVSMML